ncbi:hypothetical protein GUJ93_ZPchr0013g35897 [Zizania palustris]|uniref:DUF3527 domain-containing protein n=1 Tax=Zizania palustris TaxID=103762 RepID=A0A8J5WQR4_ZIZPA|nr:hypothetical protein GUJ93_ZPchr0013g35897 [Zizania palustris]KAG8095850.1 hypothetical protein GUJ93_ZPchr0013g35897 [Zizania palustris]KAG8095851.1 hypothetical protein GUJ93_ZPchr0013g35897 [Zizania palustris]
MELAYMERRNGVDEESATPEFSGRSAIDLPIAEPEVQSDSGQTIYKKPLPSAEKKSRSCQSCHKSPCSCRSDVFHSDLYPTLPAKMMILEFLIRSLRHPRRTHNVSDLDDMISDGATTGSVILGPSEKMMLDSLHALVNAKTRPKSPSFFHPGAKMRKARSKSHIITQSEILKLISPDTWEISSPGASPLKKSTAEFSMDDKMASSCSDTPSLSSNQPVLSSYTSSLSAGLLQCVWKDGLPHFELSLDYPMAVYTANPIKAQDNDKSLDYVYLFHSGEQGRKDWLGNSSNVSRLVGKMKVSSSLVLNSDKSTSTETEFVLYGSPDDYMRQMQSRYVATKCKGLAKRVADIMKPPTNPNSSPKHVWKFGKSSSQQLDELTEIQEGEQCSAKEPALKNLAADDLPTNQEIAAIVVRRQRRIERHQKESVIGGWGLNFLEKAGAIHQEGSGSADVQDRNGNGGCVSAIVHQGYHGGPASKNGGPASLIERWRSGGHCDCGGWDLACPIRVLQNGGCGTSPQAESQSQDRKSMELSVKGSKKNEPMLRLVNITENLNIIYFESRLSPLQCFSTGIAIIHSQAPQLYPKL